MTEEACIGSAASCKSAKYGLYLICSSLFLFIAPAFHLSLPSANVFCESLSPDSLAQAAQVLVVGTSQRL